MYLDNVLQKMHKLLFINAVVWSTNNFEQCYTQGKEVYVCNIMTVAIGTQLQLLVWLSEEGLLYSTEGPKSLGNLMDSI